MPMMSGIKHAMKNARIRPRLGRVSQLTAGAELRSSSLSPAIGSTITHEPSRFSDCRTCAAGPGVGQVVQAVEERDQIEILLRILFGRRDLEAGVCRDTVLPGVRSGVLDRARVEVVSDEL